MANRRDWRTLIKEDLSPPQARSESRSNFRKPVHYQKVDWNDKTDEIHQQKLNIKRKLEKLDTVFSSHAKDLTPEIATKSAKQQVTLKRKLESLHTEEKETKQKQAISKQIAMVRTRIQEIKNEINDIDRFLSNPFTDKRMSSEQRKAAWLRAADKKKMLEKELSKTVKEWNQLTLEEKITKRRSRT